MLYKHQLDCDRFSTQEEEKLLYDSIKEWLKKDSSEKIIENFRYLFIKGNGCKYLQARATLETIIKSKDAEQKFNFIFNRCCQLIINEWQINPLLRSKIPLLIKQISLAIPSSGTQLRVTRKLRKLVINFQKSEQYLKLTRLSNLIDRQYLKNSAFSQNTIGSLIKRYPCLHQQYLLGEDSSYEYAKTITNIQKGIQHRYELDLSRYITYRVRLVEVVRKYKANRQYKIPKKIIQPVKNPLLLNDSQLNQGLHQYLGTIEDNYSCNNLASNFRTKLSFFRSHKELKLHLLDYLMAGLTCQYSKEVLQLKLVNYLDSILPDLHANKVDEFTLLRTCSLLFKFLVVDSLHNINHYFFVDLISNLGVVKAIGILTRIVLLCDKSKPYLEQRFAILFSHYECFTRDSVSWLVDALENLQLALTIYFGKIDLSLVKII